MSPRVETKELQHCYVLISSEDYSAEPLFDEGFHHINVESGEDDEDKKRFPNVFKMRPWKDFTWQMIMSFTYSSRCSY